MLFIIKNLKIIKDIFLYLTIINFINLNNFS